MGYFSNPGKLLHLIPQLKGMTIGIYESEHFETVYPVLRLLDNGQHTISVYTTEAVASQLKTPLGNDWNKFNWILKEESQSIRSFILSVTKHAAQQGYDSFLLNTVSNNHLLFARMTQKMPGTAFYLVVHDVNNLVKSHSSFGLRKMLRHIGKKQLLKKVKGFFTISSRTTAYLSGFIKDGRPVKWLPGAIFEETNYAQGKLLLNEPIRIVVPGSLDSRRRNYQEVFEFASLIADIKMPVEICLLGGATGTDSAALLEQCKKTAEKNRFFSFYEIPEVPFEEFDRKMRAAHFIWVPSKVNTVMADDIKETYGLSKSSGNMFDAIRFAKPLLVPKELTIDKEQEEAAFVYASKDELIKLLSDCLEQTTVYDVWTNKALQVSRKYSVSNLQSIIANYFTKR